jgi:hypothetical protein
MPTIRLRRDTYLNWYNVNPILDLGEPAYDTTNNKIKIGDGRSPWRDLNYLTGFVNNVGVGFAGSRGSQGIMGYVGSKGDLGYSGSASTRAGYVGSRGVGFTGSASEVMGYNGSLGYTGSRGLPGAASAIGYTGSTGFTGFTGFTGPSGTTGYTGIDGTSFIWKGAYNGIINNSQDMPSQFMPNNFQKRAEIGRNIGRLQGNADKEMFGYFFPKDGLIEFSTGIVLEGRVWNETVSWTVSFATQTITLATNNMYT